MARRLRAADRPLVVYDPRPGAMAGLVNAGAEPGSGVAEVVGACRVTCVCVVDDEQLRAVFREAGPALAAGKIIVVHSSVSPGTVRELGEWVGGMGAGLVDAPVTGSRPAADAGTLTVLAGAAREHLAEVDSVLRTYAGRVLHVGPVGAGQVVKIANNVMLHMNHLVALEALRFAEAEGLTERAVIEAANAGTGRSWVTETWGLIDDMIFDHPQAGSEALHTMMSKEMWQAVALGRASRTAMPITAVGTQVSAAAFTQRTAQLHASPNARPGRTDGDAHE